MCRVALISKDFKDREFLIKLFSDLNKSAGGDGLGIGWFENGIPNIFKGEKITPEQMAEKICGINSDHGILFHCRRASIGKVNDENCHPNTRGNSISIHNGQVEGIGVLKLMMLENFEKYQVDGWTQEKIMVTSDSDILSYFIWKRGFDIVPMMNCGTVFTQYPDIVRMYVGHDLEAIQVGNEWIYASEFSDKMGLVSEQWLVFGKGTDITIHPNGSCILNTGYYVDGKELWKERQKKKGKNKCNIVDVI